MDFSDYQDKTNDAARLPNIDQPVVYPTLGLAGETGEVVEKVKKAYRDKDGALDPDDIDGIKKELGDVLWYLTQIATQLGIKLEDVVQANLEKTKDRVSRDKISGSGDNR